MKPRTTVPASLVRDLKAYAVLATDRDIAWQLLRLDPDVEPTFTPERRAESLAWVGYYLGKAEVEYCVGGTDCWERGSPDEARAMAAWFAKDVGRIASLQRRVARVIQALLADRPKGGAA